MSERPEFLVAPTERPPISSLGPSSSVPERHGCDVLWTGLKGLWGIQRKEIKDLIASVQARGPSGDRLGKELHQMGELEQGALIIEGRPQWTADGKLLDKWSSWTLTQQRGIELRAQREGIWVLHTRTATETVQAVEQLARWSFKEGPSSLLHRGGRQLNEWGKFDDEATAIYFLTGIPNIGVEMARRIYKRFGRVPLQWDCGVEELMSIEGIGKVRAEELMKILAVESQSSDRRGDEA